MKRLSAIAGIVVALTVSSAPAAQAATGDDVFCFVSQVLMFKFGCE